eukprot:468472_1
MGVRVNFLANTDYVDDSYDAYLVGHIIFFLCNFVSQLYLILYEWIIHNNLKNNLLTKVSFCAAFFQSISCIASIIRFNNSDPFGTIGVYGGLFGLLGFLFLNISFIITCFSIYNTKKYISPLCIVCTILDIILCILFYFDYSQNNEFRILTIFFLVTILFGLITYIIMYIKKQQISINEDILTNNGMQKLILISIIVLIIATIMTVTPLPIVRLSGSGLVYVNNMIFMKYVSKMNFEEQFVQDYDPVNVKIPDEETVNLAEQEANEEIHITCIRRLKLLFIPIQYVNTQNDELNGVKTSLFIIPESFRMWFYFGFILFLSLAMIVTTNFSDIDLDSDDISIKKRFGAINSCVFFDYPPFTWFGATLWVPQVLNILIYEIFDYYRIYEEYLENNISKCFYNFYYICSIYESLTMIFFLQATATDPDENIYFHSLPYVLLLIGLWTLAIKHFIYFKIKGIFNKYNKCVYYLGICYCVLITLSIVYKLITLSANLFEAYLWTKHGLEWTQHVSQYNEYLFLILAVICPIIIYFIFTKDLGGIQIGLDHKKKVMYL